MKRLFIFISLLSVVCSAAFARAESDTKTAVGDTLSRQTTVTTSVSMDPYKNPSPNFWGAYSRTRKQNETIIRKLTERLQTDSVLISSIVAENSEIKDSLAAMNAKVDYLVANQDKRYGPGLLCALLFFSVLSLLCLIVCVSKMSKRSNDNHDDNGTQQLLQSMQAELKAVGSKIGQTCQKSDEPVAPQPKEETVRLESYNDSVFRFTKINDHIADLHKQTTKSLMAMAFQYLAAQTEDKEAFVKKIKEADIDADDKLQFFAVADSIENFLAKDRHVIDKWLKANGTDGITGYQMAVRMPLGQPYDSQLDQDLLLGECEGQTITMVKKLGYHFPGNSIKPFREKTLVSVL